MCRKSHMARIELCAKKGTSRYMWGVEQEGPKPQKRTNADVESRLQMCVLVGRTCGKNTKIHRQLFQQLERCKVIMPYIIFRTKVGDSGCKRVACTVRAARPRPKCKRAITYLDEFIKVMTSFFSRELVKVLYDQVESRVGEGWGSGGRQGTLQLFGAEE